MQEKLKVILQNKKWTKQRLANELGVSGKTISFWLAGKAEPREKNIRKIIKIYDDVQADVFSVTQSTLKPNATGKEVQIKGILYSTDSRTVEPDDNQAYYKNELSNERRAKYYRGKRVALLLEEENRSRLILFPSLGGNEGEWYKMGGVSALIYKYRIGPRLGRQVKVLRDNDKRERFTNGITSIHFLDKFTEKMKEIGYANRTVNEFGIVIFELGQFYSDVEIREMREQARRERELFQDTIKPVSSYPEIYAQFLQLARILPKKLQKMEATQRDIFARKLGSDLMEIGSTYYSLANGLIGKEDARFMLLQSINSMLGIMVIVDEAGLMPEVGILRIGTILSDLKDAVGKMYEKKQSGIKIGIGDLAIE